MDGFLVMQHKSKHHNKIIISDEADYILSGYVNGQNCSHWCQETPFEMNESSLHSVKVTVWCGGTLSSVIGPCLFESEPYKTAKVNDEYYR